MNNEVEHDHRTYADGFRDGKIDALEADVAQLSKDMRLLNRAVWLLYGAIAIVQFLLPLIQKETG